MPQEIIFKESKSNAKVRREIRKFDFLAKKDAEREFNQKLKKAFWRHENPRQQLRDFQRQIVVYANLFMNHRKKQQKQKITEQKAHIDALFLN
ncbi:MAG TPA: hypothetical protein ACHBZ9_02435 [Arsenophonus nasoniae]|uniref:hypothetical protein n=1 Tax=Arsenophonus nasoniae TaxID=638 RepID=UPI00387939C0